MIAQSGLIDAASLLRMWTTATVRAILPDRRVGVFEDGYEASFVALEGNPLQDCGNVRRIPLRLKEGPCSRFPPQPHPEGA